MARTRRDASPADRPSAARTRSPGASPGTPPARTVDDEQLAPTTALALGQTIRAMRQGKGFRLSDLAGKTGLSVSFISQLERGLTNPSLSSLVRMAEALETTSYELLSQLPDDSDRIEFQDETGGAFVANSGGYARSLVKGPRAIQPLEIIGGPRNISQWAVHSSDEFLYVCDGTIEVEVENHGTLTLGHGASIYYSAGIRHRWHQISDEQVRLLLVLAQSTNDDDSRSGGAQSYGSHLQ